MLDDAPERKESSIAQMACALKQHANPLLGVLPIQALGFSAFLTLLLHLARNSSALLSIVSSSKFGYLEQWLEG